MKRTSKILCVALSMALLVNLSGIEVLAGEVSGQNNEITESKKDTENTVDADTGKEGDGFGSEDKGKDTADEEGSSGGEDVQDMDETEETVSEGEKSGADVDVTTPDPSTELPKEKTLDLQVVTEKEITVKPDATYTKLVVDWSEWIVEDAEEYEVAVKDSGERDVEAEIDRLKSTATFPATPGEKYRVSVTAKNDDDQPIERAEIPAILLAAPANVTAIPGDTTVSLSWNQVAGATKYQVAYGGKEESVSGTSYAVSNLKNGIKYSFAVKAVCEYEENGRTYIYTSQEAPVDAVPKSKVPEKVGSLTAIDGEKSAILTWSKASRASSYVIYRYNSSRKTWDIVKKDVTQLTYTDTKLSSGKSYEYRVAGMNDGGIGALSNTVSVSVKKSPGTKVRTIGYKAVVKSKAPLFRSKGSKKRVKYLKKGTRITTIDYGKGRYQIKLSDGKTYWLSKDRITFTASIWTTKDYSTKVKEDFVNSRGYKSPSKYLIWINAYTQRVMIFQGKKRNWKMIRNCRCATGTHLHPTPKGTFKITYKEKGWFYRSTYEKPIVHFQSQNSFHSRIKFYKGGYADATIGRPKSKGCVRLYDKDINFIYKKCPKGTTVVSH